ncbi:hypothetical protein [Achromobacter xylosoxidans]|uniref:Uncharacterized protein n=1 Tax=Alcaligenes xylosoxydans xylosoxydans TaxID=85698 RepID=A0A1R1JSK2_ALCXX|nr:hypothetical protein [Achromobacter xylosoxidans]OMG85423.1 hypothetical protein BIZ92_27130 [Achromobacter xylosoxidans]
MHPSYVSSSLSAGAAQNQPTPVPNGEIVDALHELNRVLDNLEVVVGGVFERLAPVLQPEADIARAAQMSATPRNTPFGAELARIQGRVERLHSQAADVGFRLALP